jgi:hypothetical protein
MLPEESHLSDQEILLAADGELSPDRAEQVARHLQRCWSCRARKQEIEEAAIDFVRLYREGLDPLVPPAAGPRALLRARLSEASSVPRRSSGFTRMLRLDRVIVAAAMAVTLFGLWIAYMRATRQDRSAARVTVFSTPDSRLTPGAATLASTEAVCAQANVKNKEVSSVLRKQVFREYGIADANPKAYEVDYLVTPALGGADDLRNLWPHSYSATIWNSRVKDELEDRLRDMVCSGSLELTTAQREIAEDWIGAYKKYFHTEQPLEEH